MTECPSCGREGGGCTGLRSDQFWCTSRDCRVVSFYGGDPPDRQGDPLVLRVRARPGRGRSAAARKWRNREADGDGSSESGGGSNPETQQSDSDEGSVDEEGPYDSEDPDEVRRVTRWRCRSFHGLDASP